LSGQKKVLPLHCQNETRILIKNNTNMKANFELKKIKNKYVVFVNGQERVDSYSEERAKEYLRILKESKFFQTNFLNYQIDIVQVKKWLEIHPIKEVVSKFKPKSMTSKAFRKAYQKFLDYFDTLDLTVYNYKKETVTSPHFGTKTFYKNQTCDKDFNHSMIFEAVHFGLV
jgi:hypothetical protein